MREDPVYFGIRHLSPAGAWHLRKLLDEIQPRLLLIEGPSDLNGLLPDLLHPETQPPLAILAYTQEIPVHSILYPFAAYSPEYQGILWAGEHGIESRFIDLPSEVFLALSQKRGKETDGEESSTAVYRELDRQAGGDGHETFWEHLLEHNPSFDAYRKGAASFGAQLRQETAGLDSDWPETVIREAYMRYEIEQAFSQGYQPNEIVVVTGSYHVEGLKSIDPMTEEERKSLPRVPTNSTLMPYSFYRLSSRSGYGAGNKAPAYYSLLWEELCGEQPGLAAESYLSRIAVWQRAHGTPVSSAEVIEAVRLAESLSKIRGWEIPALQDLRDAAITCLGHGEFAGIHLAVADTEIGTEIGTLPEGVSRTSIQEDFYRQLKELKLEKYRALSAQDLSLDLRENRTVKSQKAAFLDLERSFFLHRLRVLGVSLGALQPGTQENATWSEKWIVRWTPEAEIELVEATLSGDTILYAANFKLRERAEKASRIDEAASVIEDAFLCGMSSAANYATSALQGLAVEAASLEELALTAQHLSTILQYGNIRQVDSAPLKPVLEQIYFRSCLLLPGSCVCDNSAAKVILGAMERLNAAQLSNSFLDPESWLDALHQVAGRDDLNTHTSGYAAAILLERGQMDSQALAQEVHRRLSPGTPADLGSGWFEGLSMKNHYALIARQSLWQSLSDYLDSLDDEEFKRALVFLRRAFADFSSRERDEIAENLGEIWKINTQQVSEVINSPLTGEAKEMLEGLDDFDFDL